MGPTDSDIATGMQIDFGGIGKEYAVDKAAGLAVDNSNAPMLLNFGGDVVATGSPLSQRFEILLQFAEHAGRGHRVCLNPALVDALDRAYIQVIPPAAPFLLADCQARFLEHTEMLHDRGSVKPRQALAQFPGGHRRIAQQVQNLPAIRASQGLEHQIVLIRPLILLFFASDH